MKKLLLFLSVIVSSTAIHAQWTEQNTGFIDASRGISEIHIVDANTVWAVAYDGSPTAADIQEFTKTNDGGATWTPGVFDVGDSTLQITNISPVSDQICWVGAVGSVDGLGGVFKTEDGGVSWGQQNFAGYQTAGESYFDVVHFFDANTGLTMGDPEGGEFEIYKTIDGGNTWNRIQAGDLPNPLANEFGYTGSYAAVGDSFWFTTSKGRVYRTTDRGVTWNAYQAPIADFGGGVTTTTSGSIHFSTAGATGIGFMLKTVGTTHTFATTTSGGSVWTTPVAFTGTRFLINYIPGTTTLVATSADPATMGTSVSTDNGTTWINVESDEQRNANAFLDATTGWCGGFNQDEFTGGIYKLTSPLGTHAVAAATFKVYPNPATNNVTISTADADTYVLSVTDISGKVVMTKTLNGMENTLDISSLSSGAYFFKLASGSKKEVVKILKN